jgi:hypothetical protein
MAILARSWFHYGPASGWFLAERTGFMLTAIEKQRSRGNLGAKITGNKTF